MNSWLIFALLPPLLWGFGNVIDATLRRHYIKNNIALMWMWAISRLPLAIVMLLFVDINNLPLIPTFAIFGAGILWLVPALLYYKALQFEETSRVVLLVQLLPVFTFAIAFFTIGERLNSEQSIAFILLLFGGISAAIKQTGKKWHVSKALFLMALCSFLWSISDVAFKGFEPSFKNFYTALTLYTLSCGLYGLLPFVYPRHKKNTVNQFKNLPKKAWWMVIAVQATGIAGSFLFTYALTLGHASLTSVMIGTQPLIALLWGVFLARFIKEIPQEDLSRKTLTIKAVSFLLIFSGLLLLQD